MSIKGLHDALAGLINEAYLNKKIVLDEIIDVLNGSKGKDFDKLLEKMQYYRGRYDAFQDIVSIFADCEELLTLMEAETDTEKEDK